MTDLLLHRGVLLLTDEDGQIRQGPDVMGLFAHDVRLLSSWSWLLPGPDMRVVSRRADVSSRTLVLVPLAERNETVPFTVTVTQHVTATGLTQTTSWTNLSSDALEVAATISLRSDFADPFSLRSDRRTFAREGGHTQVTETTTGFTAEYSRSARGNRFQTGLILKTTNDAAQTVHVDEAGILVTADLSWSLRLGPKETVDVLVSIEPAVDTSPPRSVARLSADSCSPARIDLDALTMSAPGFPEDDIVAAGAPWFLTLFGRDSLLTLLMLGDTAKHLVPGVLRVLARTQGTLRDRRRNEQPGKIVHELRESELAVLDEVPYGRYYGSVDSTPLFLVALARLADDALQRELEPAARSAVAWMRSDGGLETTRFLRYTPDPHGLLHQGWKDSFDAIAHEDGRIATGDIALVEVQGYAWWALVETARVARTIWDDDDYATELEQLAAALKRAFRAEFWNTELEFPALALDGNNEQVNVVSSNAGHLLMTGILDDAEAARVVSRLLQPDMFTGFGVRTLSSNAQLYHPLSYHNGSVWPHDTMLTAIGMVHTGHVDEARRIARGIADATVTFHGRLPELFGGFPRAAFPTPVDYPYAAAPQAWATAAAIAAERILSE
jgi:glycogen debranching enzyme